MQPISLKELLDSANSEDREAILAYFLKRINGEPVAPLLTRNTFKISNLGTEAEIKQRISEQTGIPVDKLPPLNIPAELDKQKQITEAINELTAPYQAMLDANPKESPDKRKEVMDLGRFIQSSGLDMKIIVPEKPLAHPDFLVNFEGAIIGLEHTRLINRDTIAMMQSAKHQIEKAAELVVKKLPGVFGTVSIYIDFDQDVIGTHNFKNTKFTISEKKQIPILIADYIEAKLKGEAGNKPAFIADVRISENPEPRLDISLSENYFAKQGFKELLLKSIIKKEEKLPNYLTTIGTCRCWLLIVVNGVSSHSGFDLKYELFPITAPSKFEKIIVTETFSGDSYVIYDQKCSPM